MQKTISYLYNLGDNLSVYRIKGLGFITDSFNNYLAEVRLSITIK